MLFFYHLDPDIISQLSDQKMFREGLQRSRDRYTPSHVHALQKFYTLTPHTCGWTPQPKPLPSRTLISHIRNHSPSLKCEKDYQACRACFLKLPVYLLAASATRASLVNIAEWSATRVLLICRDRVIQVTTNAASGQDHISSGAMPSLEVLVRHSPPGTIIETYCLISRCPPNSSP